MRTKPRATSEYMMPASRPPIRTSVKNCQFTAGTASRHRRSSQIRLDDLRIVADFFRRCVGDLAAVVEDRHAVGDVHHDRHVVLDQDDRRAELVVDVENETAHVLLLLDAHARHRLVQQKQHGLGGERAGQLYPFLQAVGEPSDGNLADRLDLQEVDDLLDLPAVPDLFALRAAPVERLLEKARPHFQITPRHDVVERGHPLEEGDVLERPGDPLARRLVRIHPPPPDALKGHAAAARVVDAVDDVQERALAGAVGADDRAQLSGPHFQADSGERRDAAEGERNILDLEENIADLAAAVHAPPWGAGADELLRNAPDRSPEPVEFLLHLLVTAVQMVDAFDDRLALRRQGRRAPEPPRRAGRSPSRWPPSGGRAPRRPRSARRGGSALPSAGAPRRAGTDSRRSSR